MPYLIQVPGIPRPYITNDPRIYMDCARILKWPCEARPFSDSYCKLLRANEDSRHEGERRRIQLETYWHDHLDQLRLTEAAAIPLPDDAEDWNLATPATPAPVTTKTKHVKHDSVHQDNTAWDKWMSWWETTESGSLGNSITTAHHHRRSGLW